jgi:hypothetical protein
MMYNNSLVFQMTFAPVVVTVSVTFSTSEVTCTLAAARLALWLSMIHCTLETVTAWDMDDLEDTTTSMAMALALALDTTEATRADTMADPEWD